MRYQLITNNDVPGATPVETVFLHRGMKYEDIGHYLNTTIDDLIHPLEFPDIGEAARMLVRHMNAQDKTLIIVDSDADGFTSAAALMNYLHYMFPGFVQNNVTYWLHSGKQHGIEEQFVSKIISEDFKFVICPDSSSNDYEQHKTLKNAGIDILILDHHEADHVSEDACVINNQLCDYKNKTLSGAGVVYKFCQFIDMVMETRYSDDIMDLAALGMIGDMMDIKDMETKFIIEAGLNNLVNPFFKEMAKVQDFQIQKGGGLNHFTVSWYIVPLINAVNRMGTMKEKLLLFESMLNYLGYEQIPSTKRGCTGQTETRVAQACRMCGTVRNRQNKSRDEGLQTMERIIKEKSLLDNKILLIKLENNIVDRNICGLMANQLMAKYQHPVLILSKTKNENNEVCWEGSGRGVNADNFEDFREFLRESGYVFLAEGHANAFGAGITDTNLAPFIEYSNKALSDCDFSTKYNVDFIWYASEVDRNAILEIGSLNGLWGQGLEKPQIAIKRINITSSNIQLLSREKNPTLKITLPSGVEVMKFKSSIEEYEALSGQGYTTINLVGTCDINEWNGNVKPQILTVEYEIVGKGDYCF